MDEKTLSVRDGYIRLFGAVGSALDELCKTPLCMPLESVKNILAQAIADTEEYVNLDGDI